MQVLEKKTGTTTNGEEFGVLVIKPTGIVRPAKRTTLQQFLKTTKKNKRKVFSILKRFEHK